MASTSQRRNELDAALKAEFVPALRALGFQGSYPHFRRLSSEQVDVVGIMFSLYGPDFYVEIGIGPVSGIVVADKLISANKLKHYHVWPRIRVGDVPFDYSQLPASAVASRVTQLMPQIEEWFRAVVA